MRGINEDVDLATPVFRQHSLLASVTGQGLTPLRSPWMIPWSCRCFNPDTAPASYIQKLTLRENRRPPFTHEAQAVEVWLKLDKRHDVAVLHSIRYDRKQRGIQRNTKER